MYRRLHQRICFQSRELGPVSYVNERTQRRSLLCHTWAFRLSNQYCFIIQFRRGNPSCSFSHLFNFRSQLQQQRRGQDVVYETVVRHSNKISGRFSYFFWDNEMGNCFGSARITGAAVIKETQKSC